VISLIEHTTSGYVWTSGLAIVFQSESGRTQMSRAIPGLLQSGSVR